MFFLLNRPGGWGVTIIVSSPTAISSPQGETFSTPTETRININTATIEELITLPGIGEVKAQAIVDYRNQEGPFHRIDELMKVPGIGPATYQGLRGLVTVGEAP